MRVMTIITVLLLPALAGFALETEGFSPDQTLTYKTINNTELKLHIFNPPGHQTTDTRPAIVFFFGGGWTGGSPSQFFPHCAYLAERGMVAISAEYRIKSKHGTSPQACVKDGKSALRWIRAHAAELGIDPQRLAAGGGSAGGHVAAATGTATSLVEADEDQGVSHRPNALVLFNPVYDNGPEGYGHARVKDYWQSFSPMHNIDGDTGPTIVFLGTQDKLIPVATAEKYRDIMTTQGLRCDLHLYEGQPHGFFNYRPNKATHIYFNKTVIAMDRFLVSLGYLMGEPTLKERSQLIADAQTYLSDLSELLSRKWPRNRTINIVCHGHSVPAGYFRTPVVDTFHAYPHLLHQGLKERFPYAVINVIVTSIGGESADRGADRFARDVLTHRPDVITIDYALNDRRLGLDKAKTAWCAMIEAAQAQGVKVILLTPTGDQSAKLNDPDDPLNQHAQQIRALAGQYEVGLVDSLADLKSHIKAGGTLTELMSQVNHPNHQGHALVAEKLLAWFPEPSE